MQKKLLVPIKVKIGLRPNGHADHPDWQKLPLALEEDPASHMFYGWKYDKTSGHKEASSDSPYGMQWGMVMVTEKFAQQAVEIFSDLVTIMTEEEAKNFWETKYTIDMPENEINNDILQALKNELDLKKELGIDTADLKAKIIKAIDPNDSELGIRKNLIKHWIDAKSKLGFSIKND